MKISDQKIKEKVQELMEHQIEQRGFATPVDTLLALNVLHQRDYESWRKGRVPFLERVIQMNLHKLSKVLKAMCLYAKHNHLKPSIAIYSKWGGKGKLKFTKSGAKSMEQRYMTHFVDTEKVKQLKAQKGKVQH